MSGRRSPIRQPSDCSAGDLTPDELDARRAAFRARLPEARARARAQTTNTAVEARLPPDWLPEDDEEPERLGDVARRLVDGLATGPAMSVEVARAMLEAFDETRH